MSAASSDPSGHAELWRTVEPGTPLLWVIPLALYLLSYVLVFQSRPFVPQRVFISAQPILIALLIDGVGRAMFPNAHDTLAFAVLILAIAQALLAHPLVKRVYFPGLPDHPGHEIAKRQMRDFGGMISVLTESEETAVELVERTKLFQLAESLGGVESLIEHPARMTHASTADAPFAAPRNLVRLSVGLEDLEDILADLDAGFRAAKQ